MWKYWRSGGLTLEIGIDFSYPVFGVHFIAYQSWGKARLNLWPFHIEYEWADVA